jgi:hypothetical protein
MPIIIPPIATQHANNKDRKKKSTPMPFTALCKFFFYRGTESCRKERQCTFLHLDPNHPWGCTNVPENLYPDRKHIIDRLLNKFWPDCQALRPQTQEPLVNVLISSDAARPT